MHVKKINGRIYGADLTVAEKQALMIEAQKMVAEYDRKNENEIDAITLWVLFSEFDFEEEQLRKFYDIFSKSLDDLMERYEMTTKEEELWLCTYKLKERGIDIEKWRKESETP